MKGKTFEFGPREHGIDGDMGLLTLTSGRIRWQGRRIGRAGLWLGRISLVVWDSPNHQVMVSVGRVTFYVGTDHIQLMW